MSLKHSESANKQTSPETTTPDQMIIAKQENTFGVIAQRAALTPHTLSHRDIHVLQRTIGNQATHRLLRQTPPSGSSPVLQREDDEATRRTLFFGTTGDDVRELQEILNAQGAEPALKVDGIFGPKTLGAVREFQNNHTDVNDKPLTPDGIVGEKTWGALLAGGAEPGGKPQKEVSSVAMGRLEQATQSIEHTKAVFSYGAGNQSEALKATNFNSNFRLKVMRGKQYWKMTDAVKPLAAANPEALQAAKADLVHGGNCGEHAAVAFDYLRVNAIGETLNRSSVKGLDHAFVIMGNIAEEDDADLVVSDPWPTNPTATLWEDHFAYTPDRSKLNVRVSMVGDGENVKAVIAAGLTLTEEGKALAEKQLSDEETDEQIAKGTEAGWIWNHADAAAEDKDFDYVPS